MRTSGGLHAHYEPSVTNAVVIEVAARTHIGMVRKANEDSMIADRPVYFVADGMGGHDAGDIASATAVDAIRALAGITTELRSADVDAVIAAAREAVAKVAEQSTRGAGCTLTGVALVEHAGAPCWYVVNVGDSRVYEHSGATLTQLTKDHSLRAEMFAAGSENAEKAPRNVITRALGAEDARHDGWLIPVTTGSRLLLCSDGLTTELSDEEIRAVLTVGGRPGSVVDELVRRACEAGGRDNITVIVIDTVAGVAAAAAPHEEYAATADETIEITRPLRR